MNNEKLEKETQKNLEGGEVDPRQGKNLIRAPGMPHPLVIFLLICILISSGILLITVVKYRAVFEANPMIFGMDQYKIDSCLCTTMDGDTVTIQDGMMILKNTNPKNINFGEGSC